MFHYYILLYMFLMMNNQLNVSSAFFSFLIYASRTRLGLAFRRRRGKERRREGKRQWKTSV